MNLPKSLTIAYITSRRNPRYDWFFDSLAHQVGSDPEPKIIVVDGYFEKLEGRFDGAMARTGSRIWTRPKPTIWQGPHRLTKEDWWAKSNALNTAICLCETEWIAFVDDRSVLMPGWLKSIAEAMNENYAVCGRYEKHYGLRVVDGEVTGSEKLAGADHRSPRTGGPYPTKDWYGGSGALPLEWCLRVNGFSEDLCDGLGSEDSMFGCTLYNAGLPIQYDPRMTIMEDRTPDQIEGALKRADKGVSPRDKSHAIVAALRDKASSQNSYDIRNLRDRILINGESFPPPSASPYDWFDGQLIAEMI